MHIEVSAQPHREGGTRRGHGSGSQTCRRNWPSGEIALRNLTELRLREIGEGSTMLILSKGPSHTLAFDPLRALREVQLPGLGQVLHQPPTGMTGVPGQRRILIVGTRTPNRSNVKPSCSTMPSGEMLAGGGTWS